MSPRCGGTNATDYGAVLVLPNPARIASEEARPRRIHWVGLSPRQSFSDCFEEAPTPTRFETVGIVRHGRLSIQEIVTICWEDAWFSLGVIRSRRSRG
jgi:hypothetical protein